MKEMVDALLIVTRDRLETKDGDPVLLIHNVILKADVGNVFISEPATPVFGKLNQLQPIIGSLIH